MGSEAILRIPTVDLSDVNLKPGTHAWAAARAQVRAALDSYGCFEAAHDGVTAELREAAFAAAKELLALPMEAKLRNVSDNPYHGYVGNVPGYPFESLAVDDVSDPAAALAFTRLMWPQGNPTFFETACGFSEKAADLDGMVRRMVLESLGVEKHYDSHMGSTKYLLRFTEYPPPAGPGGKEEAQPSLPPHVDGNLCTLIYQNQVNGLEVQARSGDWVRFEPSSPNAAIFIVGDAFRAWSNDRLLSPPHRVRMPAGETRYSTMLFAVPRDEVVIAAPEELVDEGVAPWFRPYRYPDYVEFMMGSRASVTGGDVASILPSFSGTAGGGERQVQT